VRGVVVERRRYGDHSLLLLIDDRLRKHDGHRARVNAPSCE
jgi:hypothetical protein